MREIVATVGDADIPLVHFQRHKATNHDEMAKYTTMSNGKFYILATQVQLMSTLTGADQLRGYINHTNIYYLDLYPKVPVEAYLLSAEESSRTLGFTGSATDATELEQRLISLFTPQLGDNGEPTTIVFESLRHNKAFGPRPFQKGTRLLYNRYHE